MGRGRLDLTPSNLDLLSLGVERGVFSDDGGSGFKVASLFVDVETENDSEDGGGLLVALVGGAFSAAGEPGADHGAGASPQRRQHRDKAMRSGGRQ